MTCNTTNFEQRNMYLKPSTIHQKTQHADNHLRRAAEHVSPVESKFMWCTRASHALNGKPASLLPKILSLQEQPSD